METRSMSYFIKTILKEGKWFFIIPGAILLYNIINLIFFNADFTGLDSLIFVICLFLFGYTIFFLRPPTNIPTPDDKKIYASADGFVFSIENDVECPYMPGEKYNKVIIFMHVASMHWNLSPIRGTITDSKFVKGKFQNAFNAEQNWQENEHQVIIIENQETQTKMMVGMIAGLIARRIRFFRKNMASLNQGSILGLIRYGSANILYFPTSYKIKVSLKDKSRAGKTVVAEKD